jgi:hypothetical protein
MATAQEVVVLVKPVHDRLAPLIIPISINRIRDDFCAQLGIHIPRFDRASWTGTQCLGVLKRYTHNGRLSAEITISDKLNTCWGRFVACKELAHLLIDKKDDYTSDPIGLISSFMVGGNLRIDKDIHSEHWASLAAIELLVPWRERNRILTMVHAKKTNYEIASLFRVPERVIEYWRSQQYQKMMTEAWKDMEIHHEAVRHEKRS